MAASRTHTLIEKTQMYKILLAEQKIYSRYWCFIFDTDSDDMKYALQHLAKTQSTIKYLNYAVIDLGVDGKVIIGLLQLTGKLKKMTVLERFPLFIYSILQERSGDVGWQKIAQVWVRGGQYWDFFEALPPHTDFWEFKDRCLKRGRPAKPKRPDTELVEMMKTLHVQ